MKIKSLITALLVGAITISSPIALSACSANTNEISAEEFDFSNVIASMNEFIAYYGNVSEDYNYTINGENFTGSTKYDISINIEGSPLNKGLIAISGSVHSPKRDDDLNFIYQLDNIHKTIYMNENSQIIMLDASDEEFLDFRKIYESCLDSKLYIDYNSTPNSIEKATINDTESYKISLNLYNEKVEAIAKAVGIYENLPENFKDALDFSDTECDVLLYLEQESLKPLQIEVDLSKALTKAIEKHDSLEKFTFKSKIRYYKSETAL